MLARAPTGPRGCSSEAMRGNVRHRAVRRLIRPRRVEAQQILGPLTKEAAGKGCDLERSAESLGDWLGDARRHLAYRWTKGASGWTRTPITTEEHECSNPLMEPGARAGSESWIGEVGGDDVCAVPASDQAAVDLQADEWAKLWGVGEVYKELGITDEDICKLPLNDAALTYPAHTGDWVRQRCAQIDCVPARVATAAAGAAAACGRGAVGFVLIVLLPKQDGGVEAYLPLPRGCQGLAASEEHGNQTMGRAHFLPPHLRIYWNGRARAAWHGLFSAEAAAASGKHFAAVLLDLAEAFEHIRHRRLVEAAGSTSTQ